MYEEIYTKIQNLKENGSYNGKRKVLKKISEELEEVTNDSNNLHELNRINKKLNFYEKNY